MTDPFEEYADEIEEEEVRVNETLRAEAIWKAGFKVGLSRAGLNSDPDVAWKNWLLARAEEWR